MIARSHGSALDTAAKLTPEIIARVKATRSPDCLIRYVPHVGSPGSHDIDATELKAITKAGLALMLVQHVRLPGWNPDHCSGFGDGNMAAQRALAAGYALGAHIFVDLEGISGTGLGTKVYAEDWARGVTSAGYLAGCYVGYSVPLDAQGLYLLHGISSYWSDMGPRAVAHRGFAMKQHATILVDGIPFDPSTITPDAKGETPMWMPASSAQR